MVRINTHIYSAQLSIFVWTSGCLHKNILGGFFRIEVGFLFFLLAAPWLKRMGIGPIFFSAPSSPCTFWNTLMAGFFFSSLVLVALEGDSSALWG